MYGEHIKKYGWSIALLVFLIIVAETISVVTPLLYKRVVDGLAQSSISISHDPQQLFQMLMAAVALHSIGYILWRCSGLWASSIQPKLLEDVVFSAFRRLLEHSHRFFADNFTGALVRRARDFGGSCRQIIQSIWWSIIPLLVTLGGIIFVLSRMSPILGALIALFFVTYLIVNIIFFRWKKNYDEERAARDSAVTGLLSDVIGNSMNVQLFTAKTFEEGRFKTALDARRKIRALQWRLSEYSRLAQNILAISVEFIAMFIAFDLWKKGLMTVGDFVLLQTYLFLIFRKMFDIGMIINDIYEAIADAQEMVDIFNLPVDVLDKKNAKRLRVTRGAIEFKNVTFTYHQRTVLDRLNFTVRAREKVALVGPSGAGKSTVIKALLRLYDVAKGKIVIDGQSIADVTQESLRDHLALVPQEPILFHRSLKENIRYGRHDATDEEIIDASIKARCHEFIGTSLHGYDTLVGERGIKLSGGERQRIAIARAILKNAPILILDEATSSLDSESESLIQDALHELMKDKTVIVIAHRLSTIMQMDRIIVMAQGRVVESDTHAGLLRTPGIYKKLWKIQAGGFTEG